MRWKNNARHDRQNQTTADKKAMETRTATGKDRFIKVPIWWAEQVTRGLLPANDGGALDAACRDFCAPQGRPLQIGERGVAKVWREPRRQDARSALWKRLDLAKVERRKGKSPIVTLLHI
jgi:hypothetical protein